MLSYRKALGTEWPNLILGVPTLYRQRNFIVEFARDKFGPDAHVVSFDDDVTNLTWYTQNKVNGKSLSKGFLELIAADAWQRMLKKGVHLWSFNVSDNPLSMAMDRTSWKLGLCNGYFYGFRVPSPGSEHFLQFGDGHEDVERTLRFYQEDGAVLRYRQFGAKTSCKRNIGGLQATLPGEKRQVEEDHSIEELARAFPFYIEPDASSPIGVKFYRGQKGCLTEYSMMAAKSFCIFLSREATTQLEGAQWVSLTSDTNGAIRSGKVRCTTRTRAILSIDQSPGSTFGITFSLLCYALRESRFFFVWLPRDVCTAIGVHYRSPDHSFLKRIFVDQPQVCSKRRRIMQ